MLWGAGEETEEERRKYWSDKKFEKYVGLGKQLWALRIRDSSITENEREGGRWEIYSLHFRSEWILRSLWCLSKELLFMVSPNARWGVWRMACSEGWAVKFNVSFVAMAFRTDSCRSEKNCRLCIIPLWMLNNTGFVFTVLMYKEVQQKVPRAPCRIPVWLTVF